MVWLLKTEGPVSVWFSWPFPHGFKMATVAPGITSAFKTRRKKDVARQVCHALSGQQKLIQSLAPLPPPADIHLLKISLNSCIIQFSCSVMSDSLRPHRLQHGRLLCPSPTPWVYLDSCPLSRWCHPTTSSSVVPFSSCPQSFQASGSFQMS